MQLAETARATYAGRILPRFNATNVVLVGTVAIIAYLVLAPIIFLLWSSFRTALPTPANPGLFTLKNYAFVYSNPATYTLFLNTAIFVSVCTSLALLLAVGFAWLIERTDIPAKGTLFVLILLPSAVPSLLMGISYIILAGPEAGLLNRLTDDLFGVKPFNIFSLPAMFILQALSSVPSSFLIVLSALRSMDPALEEASSVSGVGWTEHDPARHLADDASGDLVSRHLHRDEYRRDFRNPRADRRAHRISRSFLPGLSLVARVGKSYRCQRLFRHISLHAHRPGLSLSEERPAMGFATPPSREKDTGPSSSPSAVGAMSR